MDKDTSKYEIDSAENISICENDESIEMKALEVQKALAQIIDVITPLIKELCNRISKFSEAICSEYPNRRVVWLAFNHRKARIRKKNMNRIIRWYQREVQNAKLQTKNE